MKRLFEGELLQGGTLIFRPPVSVPPPSTVESTYCEGGEEKGIVDYSDSDFVCSPLWGPPLCLSTLVTKERRTPQESDIPLSWINYNPYHVYYKTQFLIL